MSYKTDLEEKNNRYIEEMLKDMPFFCSSYIHNRSVRLSTTTLLSYTYNLKSFFDWLVLNNPYFNNKGVTNITVEDLGRLNTDDISEFSSYLRAGTDGTHKCSKTTIEHYISAISSLYEYYMKRGYLKVNPVDAMDRLKRTRHAVIRLENNEKDAFLSAVYSGKGLSDKELQSHEKNKIRDYAIFTLLLSSGIRVSELVALNIGDLNIADHSILVHRKGGNDQQCYFSDTAGDALTEYLDNRNKYLSPENYLENALFLNKFGQRITTRSIEKMTKKYAAVSLGEKQDIITPHKLRATFGTDLLVATGNIKLVQERMGHSSVATTQVYADLLGTDLHRDTRNLT